MWDGFDDEPLPADGGRSRKKAEPLVYSTKEEPELVEALRERAGKEKYGRASKDSKKRSRRQPRS
jgi:hypothetical protein